MASIFNADTTNGLKISSDTSGDIKFQSNGTDVVSITSSGLDAAGLTGTVPSGSLPDPLPAIDGSALTGISGGKILQVVQDTKTDTFSTSSTSFVDITGLSVSITPSSTSSKILVLVSLSLGTDLSSHIPVRLMRDSTAIAIGDSSGSRNRATFHLSAYNNYTIDSYNMTWLDSPATTSATTYKVQTGVPWSSSYVAYINRSSSDNDAAYQSRVVSTITAIEVGA